MNQNPQTTHTTQAVSALVKIDNHTDVISIKPGTYLLLSETTVKEFCLLLKHTIRNTSPYNSKALQHMEKCEIDIMERFQWDTGSYVELPLPFNFIYAGYEASNETAFQELKETINHHNV